jgi:hypothetical protein
MNSRRNAKDRSGDSNNINPQSLKNAQTILSQAMEGTDMQKLFAGLQNVDQSTLSSLLQTASKSISSETLEQVLGNPEQLRKALQNKDTLEKIIKLLGK